MSDRICGFCMTGNHENCRPEIKWYDNVWYCHCKVCEEKKLKDSEGGSENGN